MNELSGRVAFITGAGRGIGAAAARMLADRGVRVVAAVRDPAGADEVRGLLGGAEHRIIACDVADWPAVEAAVARTLSDFGRLDILVNNAGQIAPIGRITETDPADWTHSVQVNLVGAYHAARAALPSLLAAGGGVIVNVSSGAAQAPREGWSAYCAAKAGLAMLTRSLAHEYGAQGLCAYGFQPGVVDTAMQVSIRASGINEISRLKREQLAAPALPAAVIAWLCTDAAKDLAGQELSIGDKALRARAGVGDPPAR